MNAKVEASKPVNDTIPVFTEFMFPLAKQISYSNKL